MSVRFDGVNDEVGWSIGGASLTGAWTFAMILKLDSGITWNSFLQNESGGSQVLGTFRIGTSGNFGTLTGGGANVKDSGLAIASTDGWMLLAASRPAGLNQIVRYTKYPIGGSPSHSDSPAPGHDNSGAQNGIVFGQVDGSDFFDGWLAVVAEWNTNLNDAAMESLASTMTRANWLSTSPVFLVDELDVFQTDYAGSSTRTSLVGTTDDADDPAGWASWAAAGGGGVLAWIRA